jgi:hypothetical protein
MTNTNLEKGIPWRFGPDWPGQRCGAKTRRGTSCQAPAKQPVGRCRLHGGRSTGPRTAEGRARLIASKITHGRFTKEKRAEARRRAQVGREMRAELLELENWFLARGLLDKKWRDQFKIKD